MTQCHEQEKDEDQLLNLRNAFLSIIGKGLHTEVRREQYFIEVEDTDEFYVVSFLKVTTDSASCWNYENEGVRHKERALEVLVSSVSRRDDFPYDIHSIEINEKSEGPEQLQEQVKGFPIYRWVVFRVITLAEDDCERRPNNIQ